MGDVLAVDVDHARGRQVDHGEQAREGRLARPRLADHRQRLVRMQGEGGAGERLDRHRPAEQAASHAIMPVQVARLEDGRGNGLFAARLMPGSA